MSFIARIAAVPAVAVLIAGPAHAALTADQLWASWQESAAAVGAKLEAATQAKTDGVMTLNGVTISIEGDDAALKISDLTLSEESDGTVIIRPGQDISLGREASEDVTTAMSIDHDELVVVASEGEGEAVNYDFSANSVGASLLQTMPGFSFEDGVEAKPISFELTSKSTGIKGRYEVIPGTNDQRKLGFATDQLVYDVRTEDPNMETKSSSRTEVDAVALNLALTMPTEGAFDAEDATLAARNALLAGFAIEGSSTQGESRSTMSEQNQFLPYDLTATSGPGTAEFGLNKDSMHLSAKGDAFRMEANSAMLGEAITIVGDGIEMGLRMPIIATEAPGDFGFKLALPQLTLSDNAWALFDPSAALKRDAADLDIDITGTALLDVTAIDVAEDSEIEAVEPQPVSLDINNALARVAGAEVSLTGAFEFKNQGFMPVPVGTADLLVKNIDQLIDGLVKAGLVEDTDATGMRMMLSGVTKPGDEPGTLVSKIEAKEDGSIFANGQQLQ